MCICVINNCSSLKEKVTFVLCLCYKLSPYNFLSSALGSEGDEVLFRSGFSSAFAKSVLEMRSQVLARPLEADMAFFCLSHAEVLVSVTGIGSQQCAGSSS